jgi:hypothetical protein
MKNTVGVVKLDYPKHETHFLAHPLCGYSSNNLY